MHILEGGCICTRSLGVCWCVVRDRVILCDSMRPSCCLLSAWLLVDDACAFTHACMGAAVRGAACIHTYIRPSVCRPFHGSGAGASRQLPAHTNEAAAAQRLSLLRPQTAWRFWALSLGLLTQLSMAFGVGGVVSLVCLAVC